ncbi:hypothetical protein Plhal304r1_c024g0082201 [Plasmopara halstedii]
MLQDGKFWSFFARIFSCWRMCVDNSFSCAVSLDKTAIDGKISECLCISLCDG